MLGNIYLHYVLDLWFDRVVRKQCRGQAYIVRYADDFVCCFQYKDDAQAFYQALIQRLKIFNLEVAEDKTKIIPFGRFAERNCKSNGEGKPPTFDFLGFTHYCSKSQTGKFRVKIKSSSKKMRAKLKEWLKANRTTDIHEVKRRLDRSLVGYYNYYCVTDNIKHVNNFKDKVKVFLIKYQF
nr:reverse transcriptase domain-containing protein [Peribacillus cavernae]